jgi:hypothetical protein
MWNGLGWSLLTNALRNSIVGRTAGRSALTGRGLVQDRGVRLSAILHTIGAELIAL